MQAYRHNYGKGIFDVVQTVHPPSFNICPTSAWQVLPTAVHTRRGWPAKPTRHWTMRALGPAASSSTYSLAGLKGF